MISLTYLSVATEPLDQNQLANLLAVSRDRNERCNVTGMLLYADRHFIQTLEGRAEDVDATMARILGDSRHHSVDVTLTEEIEQRFFVGWSMGFTEVAPDAVADLPGFTDYLDPQSEFYQDSARLGHAGIFHRYFRDTLPPQPQ
ncbi:MAG: BLUF domain-containing protein [Nocardioides sp.]